MSSDGESSPATHRTLPAALSNALERVEALVEEGHVDEYAHNEIAKSLKGINDVKASADDKSVADTLLTLAAESPAILDAALETGMLDAAAMSHPRFLRQLFRRRRARETQPDAVDPGWLDELFDFFVRPLGDGATHEDFSPQRCIILSLLEAALQEPEPTNVSVVDELVKYLRKVNITVYMLVNTKEEDREEYDHTTAWLEEVLAWAPGLETWAVPDADTSKWAVTMRGYIEQLYDPPEKPEVRNLADMLAMAHEE